MAVKISKLFKDSRFKDLPDITKLLYIYLSTNPDLNTVGILTPNIEVVCIEVGCDIEELRTSSELLKELKYIYVKKINGIIYFIIPEHFSTIPKSEATITKVNKLLESLPDTLSSFLSSIGINVKAKTKDFVIPTQEEVVAYSLSVGHLVNGKTFVEYYEGQSERYGKTGVWVDARGTQVRDWKSKLRRVWCKDENKIKSFKEAPKGFESFHVIKEGKIMIPDGWRDSKPFSKSFTVDIELKREFNRLNKK